MNLKMETEAKIQYDLFLESGDLEDLFPSMTGEWEQDKKSFIKKWEIHKKIINNLDVC